jgi:hypothetical protein
MARLIGEFASRGLVTSRWRLLRDTRTHRGDQSGSRWRGR